MAQFSLISPSVEEIASSDFFDKVALVAHNCYQVPSKDHDSNVQFILRLVSAGHLARIEHYRFLMSCPTEWNRPLLSLQDPFLTIVPSLSGKRLFVSFSLRPILEHLGEERYRKLLSGIPVEIRKALSLPVSVPECLPTLLCLAKPDVSKENYDKLVFLTYHIVTDRGVTHELVRHRLCSFAQESTRYCNYTKGKFNSSLTFIKPLGYEKEKETYDAFYQNTADTYFKLIEDGLRPDEARSVLPNSLKASIRVSASREEWKHIFSLRISEFAHKDICTVRTRVKEDRAKKGYFGDER